MRFALFQPVACLHPMRAAPVKRRGIGRSPAALVSLLVAFGCNSSAITSVGVTATQTALQPGQSSVLTATVLGSGQFNATVTWSVDGGGPGLVPQGQGATYTAPSMAVATPVVIRATSTEDATKSGTVTLTVSPASAAVVQVTANPTSLFGGQSATLNASAPSSVPGFVWSIDASGPGTLSATSGSSVQYLAPATVAAAQTVVVRATSTADATVFGTASVTLQSIAVVVTPDTLRLFSGQTINVNGTVSGPAGVSQDVTWSVLSGGGTITASNTSSVVTYTAPNVLSETTVVLRAVPTEDTTQYTDTTLTIDSGWPAVLASTPDSSLNAPQDYGIAVATDLLGGGAYVAGVTQNGHFDLSQSLGEQDGFVAKFDQYGNLLWVHQFGTPVTDYVTGVVADTGGNVFISGYTEGRQWTPGPPGPTTALAAGFLLSYDKDGNFKWREDIGPFDGINTTQCAAFGVALDQYQAVYAAGNCATPPLGVVQRCTAGGCDGPNGGLLTLVSPIPALRLPFFQGISVDVRGAYDLVGSTNGGLQGGSSNPVGFVTQVQANTSSTPVWVGTLAPNGGTQLGLNAVATDSANNVYAGGFTDGTLPGQTSQGGLDAVLASYGENGNALWAIQFGTAADEGLTGLAFNPLTNPQELVLTGTVNAGGANQSAYVAFYGYQANALSPWATFDPGVTALSGGVAVADSLGDLYLGYTTGAQFNGPPVLGLHVGVQKLDPMGNPLSL